MKTFLRDILANYIQFLHLILNPSERKSWAHIVELDSYKWRASAFFNSTVQLNKKETTCPPIHLLLLSPWQLAAANKREYIVIILQSPPSSQLDPTPCPLRKDKTPIHTSLARTGPLGYRLHCKVKILIRIHYLFSSVCSMKVCGISTPQCYPML